MAKPFKDGKGWAFRLRMRGKDVYRSGFESEAIAKRAMEAVRHELQHGPAQSGMGPQRTSVAEAFTTYARERLPFLKGAQQDARRINKYLRALNLPLIELSPAEAINANQRVYWKVTLVDPATRRIPASLKQHRGRQKSASSQSDQVRKSLAMMTMSDVTTHHVQQLISALRAEGKKSATVHLERSELRRLFAHASAVWKWKFWGGNPAGKSLDMPEVDKGRERIVTNEQWESLSKALASYPNPWVAPLACLMLETAMRSCEPLVHLRWGHIQWQQRIIELPDAKAGRRQVPLGPGALHILKQLKAHAESPPQPEDRVFPTTYEAVKKGWAVAREAAGLEDLGLHDLRHTSATRFALEFKGNLPVIMLITGHKTAEMAMRYVNIKPTEVATMMHGEELSVEQSAAGYKKAVTAHFDAALVRRAREAEEKKAKKRAKRMAGAVELETLGEGRLPFVPAALLNTNVISVDFARRAA